MAEAERYPLDFDALTKGQVITEETLVGLFGTTPEFRRFATRQVALKDRIETELRKRGKFYAVAIVKNEIHILTDEQASEYTPQLSRKGEAMFMKGVALGLAIDTEQLSPEARRKLARRLEINAWKAAALSRPAPASLFVPAGRKAPRMIEG